MISKDYLPQNINDTQAVQRLALLPFEAIKQDVPQLLEWLQDAHWDVAEGIAEFLRPHINEITQELLFILNSDDSMWKYYVICILISKAQQKLNPVLIRDLLRIAEHPSAIDAEDTVDNVAKMVIGNKMLCS